MPDGWFKSSKSQTNGTCVEVRWRKSTRSAGNGNCVEVADGPDGMLVRDSKDPDGPVLEFGRGPWMAFLAGVKAGEFD